MPAELKRIASYFAVDGELVAAAPFGGGHINDSHLLTFRAANGGAAERFLLQRINRTVFKNPPLLMENIQRVRDHIRIKLETSGAPDLNRRVLTLVPTRGGRSHHHCRSTGAYWRMFHFIERVRVHDAVTTPREAYAAGRAYGEFQCHLADYRGPRLHETIPDFHNTPLRFEKLERVVRSDPCRRVAAARTEIERALSRRSSASLLLDLQSSGALPERIAHNDAKISNVLLDEDSGEALCVIDLDTVMPGLALYDFGDMVRSMTSGAAEDETDLAKVTLRMPLFEALTRGYLETAAFLTSAEREHLVTAAKLITLEQSVRFLSDYLAGDVYYKTQRPEHNLDRCRTQLRLLESIEEQENKMRKVIAHVSRPHSNRAFGEFC